AVEHGVGHVRGLGAGRAGILDHGVEHLGRHDHRLRQLPAQLHAALLDQRYLVERHLHTEIAARHHDAVERVDDLLEYLDRLGLLHLGDDRTAYPGLVHDLVDELDVVAGDDHAVAGTPLVRPVREPAQPDLRALQVGQDPDGPAGRLGRLPDVLVHLLVVGVAAMAEVQAGDVHAGVHQATDALGAR